MTATAQRLSALETANSRRFARAGLRRRVAAGEIGLAEAIECEGAAYLRVFELLLAVPRVGERSMRCVVARAGDATGSRYSLGLKRVGELTPRQREAIVAEFSHQAGTR